MSTSLRIVVILVVIAIALFVVFGFFGIGGLHLFGVGSPNQGQAHSQGQSPAQALLAEIRQNGGVSELKSEDIAIGSGDPVQSGDAVTVNYIGALPNGTVFDSSDAHGSPFTFTVGAGQVIKGWDEGLLGMKEGGVRLLAIPPELAYGAHPPAGSNIPPNSTLLFQVQLVKRAASGAASAAAPAPAPAPAPAR